MRNVQGLAFPLASNHYEPSKTPLIEEPPVEQLVPGTDHPSFPSLPPCRPYDCFKVHKAQRQTNRLAP
jgi:hypothetical protein